MPVHNTLHRFFHILDGLDDWPTHVLHLKSGKLNYCGPISKAPGFAERAPATADGASGSLFTLVKGWLLSEREEKHNAALDVQCASTPSTEEVKAGTTQLLTLESLQCPGGDDDQQNNK